MTDLHAAFRELLVSPAKLAQCAQAATVTELLPLLKQWLRLEHENDQTVITELNALNREVWDLDAGMLAPYWLPCHYYAKDRAISWCLPQGRATTPFFDQFIERCRQQVVNQFLKPRTSLARILGKTNSSDPNSPAGFIFHVSRCGSTLASGCLAELEHVSVFSESPLLTEALLDPGLTTGERRQLLQTLMSLQNCWQPESKAAVVKWNAWDLFHWPLIRSLYPQVPVLLLIRNPMEVLASHQRLAGRHMAGDPSLAALNPAFAGMNADETPLDFRIRVLHSLFEAMHGIGEQPGVMAVDYTQLDAEKVREICLHFGVAIDRDDYTRIRQRMQFHSKELNRRFEPDSLQKRQQFSARQGDKIHRKLDPLYERLLAFTSPRLKGAAAC